ncbi:hypothetical protein [Wolbachia endosymbiont (group A) of Apotomis capreana]|uniref:hypothetical protein n=1 Tax=Wolbachia endosymbiont (group A) of Apotomis capreana TaxID=3066165 RepID=UPI0038058E92
MTLESSLYYAATWLKLSLLDPSSQGTGMTKEGSVSYSDDTLLVDNVCIVVRHALE